MTRSPSLAARLAAVEAQERELAGAEPWATVPVRLLGTGVVVPIPAQVVVEALALLLAGLSNLPDEELAHSLAAVRLDGLSALAIPVEQRVVRRGPVR